MAGLVRLFLLLVILFVLYQLVKTINGLRGKLNHTFARGEQCPACNQRVSLHKQDPVCPQCGTRLVRTEDGKLRIRVN